MGKGAGNLAQMQLSSGKDAINHLMNEFKKWGNAKILMNSTTNA